MARLAPTLAFLDVADTGLVDASQFAGLFPCLEELHASENVGLKSLTTTCVLFPILKTLALASCGVDSWRAVDDLNCCCPKLERLRFGHDNPVVRCLGPSEARAFLIARVPGLVQVNGADVSKKERVDAEKRYLRVALAHQALQERRPQEHALALDSAAAKARLEVLKKTYDDVLRAHLQHADPAKHAAFANTLAANLLSLKLRSVAAASCGNPIATEQLPASTKVALLKRLAAKLFDLDIQHQLLYFKSEPDAMPTFLDDDSATLAYFGLQDGATIDVAEKLL